MNTIELKIKKSKATAYDCWEVKHGRKLHAKIYLVRSGECAGQYQIVVNGCGFYRESLEAAKDFVIANMEGFLNIVGFSNKVVIKEG